MNPAWRFADGFKQTGSHCAPCSTVAQVIDQKRTSSGHRLRLQEHSSQGLNALDGIQPLPLASSSVL